MSTKVNETTSAINASVESLVKVSGSADNAWKILAKLADSSEDHLRAMIRAFYPTDISSDGALQTFKTPLMSRSCTIRVHNDKSVSRSDYTLRGIDRTGRVFTEEIAAAKERFVTDEKRTALDKAYNSAGIGLGRAELDVMLSQHRDIQERRKRESAATVSERNRADDAEKKLAQAMELLKQHGIAIN